MNTGPWDYVNAKNENEKKKLFHLYHPLLSPVEKNLNK